MAGKFLCAATLATVVAAAACRRRDDSSPAPIPPVGQQISGFGTYYNTYDSYGSCGTIAHDTDLVVAISDNYGHNAACGRHIQVTGTKSGASTTVQVVDTCGACKTNNTHLDLSPAAAAIVDPSYEHDGVFDITWAFVD